MRQGSGMALARPGPALIGPDLAGPGPGPAKVGPDLEGQGQGQQNWLRAGPDRTVDSLPSVAEVLFGTDPENRNRPNRTDGSVLFSVLVLKIYSVLFSVLKIFKISEPVWNRFEPN